MCQTVSELRQAATHLSQGYDPGLVRPAQLAQVLRDAGVVAKMMASIQSLTAARMAAIGPTSTGPRQAARELAHASGTSLFEANRALQAGKLLQGMPDVASAARLGELSPQQVALVAGAVAINSDAAPRLLALAKTGSLQELSDEAARARAANQDLEARRQAVHAARGLRSYTDPFGTWNLHAKGTPENGAEVMAAISAFADKVFALARKEGRREAREAYAFDGLVALATAGGAQPAATEVLVRVDHSAIVRGYPIDGEVCEIVGLGPISPLAVRDIFDSGDPFLKAVVTKGKDVVGVVHLGRRPNAAQQTALDWMFPTCAAEGCGTRGTFLETDHRLEWCKNHVTVLDLLDRLCKFHHYLKTHQGWALVHGRGKRGFVPPDDPGHPRNARE